MNCRLFAFFWYLYISLASAEQQCTLKDEKLKCGAALCSVTIGSPKIPSGKYRIGTKQTESAEGLPSPPFHYIYKAINNDPSKGFWAELTFTPDMSCSKETPWMNSDSLAVANSIGMQNPSCYNSTIRPVLANMRGKQFEVKVCPSANACKTGQCANLASLGSMKREYLTELVVQ